MWILYIQKSIEVIEYYLNKVIVRRSGFGAGILKAFPLVCVLLAGNTGS